MQRGSILIWPKFQFHDGVRADKLIIVLNAPSKKSVVLVTVTSKKNKRTTIPECQPEPVSFFFPAGKMYFLLDTWVVLSNQPYVYDVEDVQKQIDNANIKEVYVIPEQTVNAIRNCLVKNSRLLTENIKTLLK